MNPDLEKKYQDLKKKRRLIFLNSKKERHLELLKYLQDLKRQKKSISTEDSSELLGYLVMLESHLDWEASNNYLQLLEDFMKEKIDSFEFCITFEERGRLNSEIVDILESNLILLSPHEKSLDFSDLLREIFNDCEAYLKDTELHEESSEIEF